MRQGQRGSVPWCLGLSHLSCSNKLRPAAAFSVIRRRAAHLYRCSLAPVSEIRMQHVIAQLESVRRTTRMLLVSRRLLQWLAAILTIALFAGLVDYALRLPSGVRFAVGVTIVVLSTFWLITRLLRAAGFKPDLATLALRAEKVYPQLSGALASGVEFATHPDDYADPHRTASLANHSIENAQQRLGKQSLSTIINKKPTLRTSAIAGVIAVIFAGVIFAAPKHSALAAQRWVLPFGQVQWPRRNNIESLVTKTVEAIDAPLRLSAKVDQGYEPGMRAWVYYRVADASGEFQGWERSLMSEQAAGNASAGQPINAAEPAAQTGVFQRLVDLSGAIASTVEPNDSLPAQGIAAEFYFKAGDDWTETQQIKLVPRPTIKSVVIHIEPPAYAKGLIEPQTVALHRQTGRSASASGLVGSTVELGITLNKPLPDVSYQSVLPGFAKSPTSSNIQATYAAEPVPTLALRFVLTETIESSVRLVDEHGLSNLSERVYRLDARTDKAPTTAMLQPASDETVLPSAVIDLQGIARDDVGVATLSIEEDVRKNKAAIGQPATEPESNVQTLAKRDGRDERLTLDHQLDLGPLDLKSGDQVVVTAVANDVYEIDGQQHKAVRSTPRTLRIVDESTLITQLRTDLAGVRQQAIRLESRQREVITQQADQAQPRQNQLTQSIAKQKDIVDRIATRMTRNNLKDPQLKQLLSQSKDLLNKAGGESQAATQKLDQSRKETADANKQMAANKAKTHQQNTSAALKELVAKLDQGRDAMTLQLQARQLEDAQNKLAEQTRATLPKTAGRDRNDLKENDRNTLDDIAKQQKNLADQADELVKQMKATAEAMQRDAKSPQDKATAQSLQQAAATAQKQGLSEKMKQASKDAKGNKLSQANNQQQQAQNTLKQMLQQMQQGQEEKQQEILRRLLAKLEQTIVRLIEQQKAQLSRLDQAKVTKDLAEPLSALRRNTLAVAEEARTAAKTGEVSKLIDAAATSQGEALFFLRGNQKAPATTAETAALKSLEDALALVRKLNQEQQQEKTQQQREELRQEYERLAALQDALRQQTEPLAQAEQITRRQRAELLKLANEQDTIKADAEKLRDQVAATLVFQHLHLHIDEAAQRITDKLRTGKADTASIADQHSVASKLRLMAGALAQAKKDKSPFESNSQAQAGKPQQQQAGGKKPPIVPPLAELRLLRGLQETVYKQTRAVGEGKIELTEQTRVKVLQDLSGQQQDLSELGDKLIRRTAGLDNIESIPKQEKTEQDKPEQDKSGQPEDADNNEGQQP